MACELYLRERELRDTSSEYKTRTLSGSLFKQINF
jgi:hypothetical protein